MFNFLKKKNSLKPVLKGTADKTETCSGCKAEFPRKTLIENFCVCPECGKYIRIPPRTRIAYLADKNSFRELFSGVTSRDFLEFPGYTEKLEKAKSQTGEREAVLCGTLRIEDTECAVFVMDPRFIMASMGSAVGEKITRLFEYATKNSLPVIGFTASGGARMQEGIFSLMQMAKTAAAIDRFQKRGGLYISCLTHPTTGGVTASFASLGDIMLAEPGALIGFAGPRVIEQTIGEKLPEGFQSAEALLQNGFLDQIVPRDRWRAVLSQVLLLHEGKKGGAAL